jgi:CheY-like chemotaxis protein
MIRVLIVDDNRDAADSLTEVLRLMGHTAEAAYSGSEALARMDRFSPDLFLLDLALPDIDGYELMRRLRRVAREGAKFLAETGYGTGIGGNVSEHLFDDHVIKPMSPQALLRVLGPATSSEG